MFLVRCFQELKGEHSSFFFLPSKHFQGPLLVDINQVGNLKNRSELGQSQLQQQRI